jgi:hypothetical protein
MATKRKTNFLKKQVARRKKMHPVRRKQENMSVVMFIVSVAFFIIGGPLFVAASMIGLVGAAFSLIASAASPPPKVPVVKSASHKTRNTAAKDSRVHHGTLHIGITGKAVSSTGRRRKACTAACQWSRKPAHTCDCSCGSSRHGEMAPRKTATKRPATTRKRVDTKKRSS